jgi:insulysin
MPDKTEKWFQAEYAVRPISSDWIAAWQQAAPSDSIRIADPNPFLPRNLEAIAADANEPLPLLVSETESGLAYYARAPEFAAPEAAIHLYIRSPEIQPTPKSAVLLSLYLDHLTDDLHPITGAAQSAGLTTRFDLDKLKLRIQIFGYSEKAPLLLNEILKKLSLKAPTQEQFDIYKARHAKSYSNASKELPLRQAKELLDSILVSDRSTQTEKLAALKTITYEEFVEFHHKLFAKTYTEGFFTGNLSFQQAESSWIDVQHILSRGSYPKTAHAQSKVLELPDQGGPFALERMTDVQGNGVLLAIDEGALTLEKRSVQDLLAPPLKEGFYNELRTKQKTAYIASADPTELEERLFHLFMVQSNSHQPEDLLYRFELFLEEYVHTLPDNISKTRFETLKASSVHSIKTRYRNLRDKAALLNLLAFEKGGDFAYLDKRIDALNQLTYERFLELSSQMLSRTNTKRLAVLFEGRTPTPFSYESVDTPRLLELGRYVAKEERQGKGGR